MYSFTVYEQGSHFVEVRSVDDTDITAQVGEDVRYSVYLTSEAWTNDVDIEIALPTDLATLDAIDINDSTFDPADTEPCVLETARLVCHFPSLNPMEQIDFDFYMTAATAGTSSYTVTSSSFNDMDTTDNKASYSLTVTPAPSPSPSPPPTAPATPRSGGGGSTGLGLLALLYSLLALAPKRVRRQCG